MSSGSARPVGEVLRLRNLTMIENIRRAEDLAWREQLEQLEQQQVLARLSRLFGGSVSPLDAMHEHASTLEEALAATLPYPASGAAPPTSGGNRGRTDDRAARSLGGVLLAGA